MLNSIDGALAGIGCVLHMIISAILCFVIIHECMY